MTLGLLIGLLACDSDGGPDENPEDPEPPGPRGYNAVAYTLVGTFDWTNRQLNARETIVLDVAPGHPTIELDTRVEVEAISTLAGAALTFEHDRPGARLNVELGQLGTTGGRITLVVDYRVGTSDWLMASDGRDDDPVTSRMLFTDSEPQGAREWLVANDHPSDRALWSVELTVPVGEDVVANGVRISDSVVDGARVVRYRLDKRIPTYLMAFAAGEIDHSDRTTGRVPLSIWYRRGLLVNAEAHLDMLAEMMERFERLLGPYPWPSYGVLLVPFPFAAGGMENTTLSFILEASGQGDIVRRVNAHELSHQWIGCWVTMEDYEDLWVKEGMATMLGAEGDRPIRDGGTVPRLFGLDYTFDTGLAIVDRELYGLDRYTRGPYQRAAWLITQIRARLGEAAFWDRLRAMLDANALGALNGERFLQGFAPALSAAEIEQLTATLELKTTPTIALGVELVDSNRQVTVELSDPDRQLLLPLKLTVVNAAGEPSFHEVRPGEPRIVPVPADAYLAPDEADLSAPWHVAYNLPEDVFLGQLAPLLAPSTPAERGAFTSRSTAHQELTLANVGLPVSDSSEFAAFYAELDSTLARRNAEAAVCRNAVNAQAGEAWRAQIAQFLGHPGVESFSTAFSRCIAPQAAADELVQLASAPTAATARRLSYLLSFDYGPGATMTHIGKVAATAPSLQLREQALDRLAAQLNPTAGYSPVLDLAPWRALFRDQLAHAESAQRFNIAWNASRQKPEDLDALPIVAARLHLYGLSSSARRRVVCEASAMTGGDDAAWQSFRNALHRDALPASVLVAADDPLSCSAMLHASSEPPDRVRARPL